MGEDALYGRHRIKIGTCEDMYYLRAGQAKLVRKVDGSLDPNDRRTKLQLRFRFPWPDEDGVAPGVFDRHDRGLKLHGVALPEDVEHGRIQFKADPGYLISLPCPESPEGRELEKSAGVTFGRNGFPGNLEISSQKWIESPQGDRLVLVCRCTCRSAFRIERYEDALPMIEACRKEAKNKYDGRGPDFWTKVADRIEMGYRGEAFS